MPGKPFHIRNATTSDITEIVAMCKRTLAATYGSFLSEQAMKPWIEGDEAEKYITPRIDNTILLIENKHIAGIIIVVDAMIELLWVDGEYRGKGFGKMLIATGETKIKEQGFEQGQLQCFSDNVDAIAFYQHQGWAIVNRKINEVVAVEEVVMQKTLS